MVKKITCIICATVIIVFNCIPCFALESFSKNNFIDIANQYMVDDRLNFINNNINSNIHFFILDRDFSRSMVLFKSKSILKYEFLSNNTRTLTITNESYEDDYLYTIPTYHNGTKIPANSSITWDPGGYGPNFGVGGLLIHNGDCVNKDYCSPEVYVDMSAGDDYEEGGVVISGLVGFFNNMIKGLKDIRDSIINLPTTIINGLKDLFIPNSENMKSDFNDFISFFRNKLGYGPILDTLNAMVNVDGASISAANFKKDFSFKVNGSDVNMSFILPFSSYFEGDARADMVSYMKGLFFILLLFYNLSEIYFLIRGVHPWKDSSNNKEVQ